MKHVIYKIINIQNQKFYVGSAADFAKRAYKHKLELRTHKHHCAHLQAAWDKYGGAAFVFVVVEEVAADRNLLEAENVWLKEHAGKSYCYNTARDAAAPMRNASEETRAKLSASRVGKHAGDKHYRFGQTVSEEVRKKIGDTQRGRSKAPRVISEEGMAKIRAAASAGHYATFTGKHHSDETKKLLGEGIIVQPSGRRFDTITEMRAALGVPISLVHRSLKTNKPVARGVHTGLSFQYQDERREAERLRIAAELAAAPKKKTGRPAGQVNESQVRAVHAMPEDKVYPSVAAYIKASGRSKKAVYEMLKGIEPKRERARGWTVKYV